MSRGQNRVRIIGGQWRRQHLHFPEIHGLRPTPDRVRETLFNWLGQTLTGMHCLDLFAGSGALGFEAASRGAARVVLVEQSSTVRAALMENKHRLQASSVEVLRGNALEFAALGGPEPCFDVLFLDPPYRQGFLEKLLCLIPRLLKPEGLMYVEAETYLEQLGDWQTVRDGKAGQVYYHLMRQLPPEA